MHISSFCKLKNVILNKECLSTDLLYTVLTL